MIGSWDVVLGKMITPTVKLTRTEEDFAWHIHDTIQTDAQAGWIFVLPFEEESSGSICILAETHLLVESN